MEEARALAEARRMVCAVDLNARLSGLDGEAAYAIQRATVAARGGRVAGYKIGWADPAVRSAAGVPEPIFGRYLAEDLVPDGGTVAAGTLIRPAVEGEFAVVVEREVGGQEADAAAIRRASRLTLGFDLFDSRLVGGAVNWRAAVADNCGAGLVVIGSPRVALLGREELVGVELSLSRDETMVGAGTGQKIDDPAAVVAWLARKLSGEGEVLRPGQFVLLGAVAGPLPMGERGSWAARAPGIGTVRVTVAP